MKVLRILLVVLWIGRKQSASPCICGVVVSGATLPTFLLAGLNLAPLFLFSRSSVPGDFLGPLQTSVGIGIRVRVGSGSHRLLRGVQA